MGSQGGRSDGVDGMPSSALSLARDRDDLGCHGQYIVQYVLLWRFEAGR